MHFLLVQVSVLVGGWSLGGGWVGGGDVDGGVVWLQPPAVTQGSALGQGLLIIKINMIDIYRYEAMDFDVIRHHYYIQNSCLVHNISTNLLLSLALSLNSSIRSVRQNCLICRSKQLGRYVYKPGFRIRIFLRIRIRIRAKIFMRIRIRILGVSGRGGWG